MGAHSKKVHGDVNKAVGIGTVMAVATGLYRASPDCTAAYISTYLFVAFFVFLRLKLFFDDYVYFETKAEYGSAHFKVGFMLSIVSWAFMVFAAARLDSLHTAYLLLSIAIGFSTVWIVADALRAGAYREQYYWLAFNAGYMVTLGFLIWIGPNGAPIYVWPASVFLLLVLLADYITGRPFRNLDAVP